MRLSYNNRQCFLWCGEIAKIAIKTHQINIDEHFHPTRTSRRICINIDIQIEMLCFRQSKSIHIRSENREFAFRVKHQIQLLYPLRIPNTDAKCPRDVILLKSTLLNSHFSSSLHTQCHIEKKRALFSLFLKPFIVHMGMWLCLARIVCEYVLTASRRTRPFKCK